MVARIGPILRGSEGQRGGEGDGGLEKSTESSALLSSSRAGFEIRRRVGVKAIPLDGWQFEQVGRTGRL